VGRIFFFALMGRVLVARWCSLGVRETLVGVKVLVREILSSESRARNDDRFLILCFLRRRGFDVRSELVPVLVGGRFVEKPHIVLRVPEDEWGCVPAFETITRVRREIQNRDGEFLPTDPLVLVQRGIREELVREYYVGRPDVVERFVVEKFGVR